MTDDAPRPQQAAQHPQHPDWSGHQADGTRAWGLPTHAHDPQHTAWAYNPDAHAYGPGYPGYPGAAPQWNYGEPFPPAPPQGSGSRRGSGGVAGGAAGGARAGAGGGVVAE